MFYLSLTHRESIYFPRAFSWVTNITVLLGPDRVLKCSSFFLSFFGSTSSLTLIDKLQSSHVLFNGGLDCRCRPSFFSLKKETPSHGSTFTCAPLLSGLKLWQNFYRADCSNEQTVGDRKTDQRVCDTFNYLLGTSD